MSITDCSLVGGADRSHPMPSPPVASVRSMEPRYPTVDDGDGAEGNGSKRKQEDNPDNAPMESTEKDDVDDSEANTSNRCTVLRFESINKKNRTSCIVPDTDDEKLIASVWSTAMEVVDGADGCPPNYASREKENLSLHLLSLQERPVRINNVVHRRIVLEGTHCPPICPGHQILYASTKRAIDVDIGFVSAMYSITKGCNSHEATFVCSDTQKSATMYLIRRSFVSPFLFLKDSWHQRTITINGREHFLHRAEGESDFLFALMKPVKELRLIRDHKVLSPRGELLSFYTLVISTGEKNAFGEEALSAAALDPFDAKYFYYGRDLFCRGTVRTCYHMYMDKYGVYNMNSSSTEQWALKIHRYSSRHESWLDDSWQQFRKQLAAEQLVQCSSMRSRLVGYGSGNENIFNEMEVMAYIDGRIAVQPIRTGVDQQSTSWMDRWPHFVPLRATGICFDNIYLATKLYPLGSVHDYMRRQQWNHLEETAVRVIVRQVLLSLRLLHSYGICHRDISPHNIVLEQIQQPYQQSMDGSFPHNMRFVLMDMGHTAFHSFDRELRPDSRPCRYSSAPSSSSHHSKGAFGMLKRPTSRIPPGKVHYHCPELPRAEAYCGFAVDVWQIGVLIFTLLFGHGPFDAEVPAQLLLRKNTWFRTVEDKKLLKAKLVYKDEGRCLVSIEESGLLSDDCMSFLDRVLQSDPAQRMKVDEALQHRWLL